MNYWRDERNLLEGFFFYVNVVKKSVFNGNKIKKGMFVVLNIRNLLMVRPFNLKILVSRRRRGVLFL